MFDNFTPYTYVGEPVLDGPRFQPCKPTQGFSIGFMEPGAVRLERRAVPPQALDRRVRELSEAFERETGLKPGRKAVKEFKEQALMDLLPRAFPKAKDVRFTYLEALGLLVIGTTSESELDAIITLLLAQSENLSIGMLTTKENPTTVLSGWVGAGECDAEDFMLGRKVKLTGIDGKVSYEKHVLDCDNVREHLKQGKVVEELALDFGDEGSFVLTSTLQFKSVDVQLQGEQDEAELVLWRHALDKILRASLAAFGGRA